MKPPSRCLPYRLGTIEDSSSGSQAEAPRRRYVGNKMATYVLNALGADVSAINTVSFSNHTAYKSFLGRRTPAEEILQLYEGLKQNALHKAFNVLLSGYTGSADAVHAVGAIARDLRLHSSLEPGKFFWVLDPVMGDEGRLYVAEDIVPVYRSLLQDADLLVPNAFEAELLSEVKIVDMESLVQAIGVLHSKYLVPHVVVTSLRFDVQRGTREDRPRDEDGPADLLRVVGSTATGDHRPRLWSISVPSLPIFFSGTGDMFAALMVMRLREAIKKQDPTLFGVKSWQSPDEVESIDLPLAKAAEKVLASMHAVLTKTAKMRDADLEQLDREASGPADGGADSAAISRQAAEEGGQEQKQEAHAARTKASEVRVVQCAQDLREPKLTGEGGMTFKADPLEMGQSQ